MPELNFPLDPSEPIAILSSSEISKKELTDFLSSLGAAIEESNSFWGRFSEGNKHIWISISNEELEYLTTFKREAIVQCLQDEPKTCIVLELSSTKGSEQILIKFAIAFTAQWSCAICNFTEDSKVYTVQQLHI